MDDGAPVTPEEASHYSAQSSLQGMEDASMAATSRAALACRPTRLRLAPSSGITLPLPLPAGPEAPLAAALSHQLTVVVCGGPSGPLNCLPVAFVSPVAGLLGSLVPQSLTGAPQGAPEAGGLGPEVSGLVVGCFSQQQLSYWAACTSDPWVVPP